MLQIARLRAGRGDYYLSDLAAEVSAVRPPMAGPPTTWCGRASAGLGLAGSVDPTTFAGLLDGRGPHGRPLAGAAPDVVAYDLTFTCPKSVSVLYGVGRGEVPGEVVAAHDAAVVAAVDYVEAHAISVRRGTGEERRRLPTGGVMAAAFTHGLSRALDPHLHSHVVVANVARGTDGRWSAVDGRSLLAHSAAAGSLYDCHLRAELVRRLGVEWDAGPMGAATELRGIDPAVRAEFSGRGADIRRQLFEWNAGTPRAARAAWAATRSAKSDAVDPERLERMWVGRAQSAGLVPVAIDRITGRRTTHAAALDEHRFAAALWVSPHASPTRRDVVAAWSRAATQGAPGPEVLGAVDAWAPADGSVGIDEPRRALRSVLPDPAVVRTLGPRPLSGAAQHVYREGAATLEAYRRRWGVADGREPLGVDGSPASLAALPARRLADHLEVERSLQRVARALGREAVVRTFEQGLARGRALAD